MKNPVFICFFLFLASACNSSDSDCPACSLEPDPGLCKAAFPKYYYDQEEGKCKEFTWGGCEGVVPFQTMEECKDCKCK